MDVSQVSAGPETRRRKVAALRPLFEQLAALNDPEQLEQLLRDREQRGAGPRERLRGATWAAGKSGAVLDQLHEKLAAANRQARLEGKQPEASFKQALEDARGAQRPTERPEPAEPERKPRDADPPQPEARDGETQPAGQKPKADVTVTPEIPAKAQTRPSQSKPDPDAERSASVEATQAEAVDAKASQGAPDATNAAAVTSAKEPSPQATTSKPSNGTADGAAKQGRPTPNAGKQAAQTGQGAGESRTPQSSETPQKPAAASANAEGKPRDASSTNKAMPQPATPANGDSGNSSKPATAGSNAQVEAAEQSELAQAAGAPGMANVNPPAASNGTTQTTPQTQTQAGTVKAVAKPMAAAPAARAAAPQASARGAQSAANNPAPAEQASNGAPENRARAEAGRNVSKLESTARNLDRLGKNDANIERILRFVVRSRGGETTEATMRLDPPELGRIRVRMVWQGGHLSLELEAQNEMAQRLLRQDLDGLRRGLQHAGIQLDKAEVRSAATPESSSASQDATGQDNSFGRQSAHSADAERRGVPQGREAGAGGRDQDDPGHADDPSHGGAVGLVTESLVNVIA